MASLLIEVNSWLVLYLRHLKDAKLKYCGLSFLISLINSLINLISGHFGVLVSHHLFKKT
jgi:hypothetical protein